MPETTAEVEQLLASLETSDDVGVLWCSGDVNIQVAPASNAAIREDSKGFFTLRGRLARGKVGWVTGAMQLTTAMTWASISLGGMWL
jgi:hypothetical protein